MRTEDPGFLTTGGVYTDDVVDERLAGNGPAEDIYADRAYRQHLARVLTRRALERQTG